MNNFCSRWPNFLSFSGVQDGLFIVITPRYFFVDFWPRERKRNKLRRTEKLTRVLIHCCNLLNITWMDNVLCLCVLRGCLESPPPPKFLKEVEVIGEVDELMKGPRRLEAYVLAHQRVWVTVRENIQPSKAVKVSLDPLWVGACCLDYRQIHTSWNSGYILKSHWIMVLVHDKVGKWEHRPWIVSENSFCL